MREKKYVFYVIGIIFFVLVVYSIIGSNKRDKALENHVLVIANIKRIEITRAAANVFVEYKYNGKIINNDFPTYHTDSLKVNQNIRLIISKEYPDKYIKYVGIAEQ